MDELLSDADGIVFHDNAPESENALTPRSGVRCASRFTVETLYDTLSAVAAVYEPSA